MRAPGWCLIVLSLSPALADSITLEVEQGDGLRIPVLSDAPAGREALSPPDRAALAPVDSRGATSSAHAEPFELGHWLETPDGARFYDESALDPGGFGQSEPLPVIVRLRLPGQTELQLRLDTLRTLPAPASADLLDPDPAAGRRRLEQFERALRPPQPAGTPDGGGGS